MRFLLRRYLLFLRHQCGVHQLEGVHAGFRARHGRVNERGRKCYKFFSRPCQTDLSHRYALSLETKRTSAQQVCVFGGSHHPHENACLFKGQEGRPVNAVLSQLSRKLRPQNAQQSAVHYFPKPLQDLEKQEHTRSLCRMADREWHDVVFTWNASLIHIRFAPKAGVKPASSPKI